MLKKIISSAMVGLIGFNVCNSVIIPHVDFNDDLLKLNDLGSVDLDYEESDISNKIILNENTKWGLLLADDEDYGSLKSFTIKSGQYFLFPQNSYKWNLITSAWFKVAGVDVLPKESYTSIKDDVNFSNDIYQSPNFDSNNVSYISNNLDSDIIKELSLMFGEVFSSCEGLSLLKAKSDIVIDPSTFGDKNYPGISVFMLVDYVGDNKAPSITGTNNFIVNVNNMLSIENILSHVSANDDTDGLLKVLYDSSTTTYNPSNKEIGEYIINAYAEDKAGNRTDLTITVTVADIDKPVISGTKNYTQSYDNPLTLDDIKNSLVVSDNYDSSLELEVVSDNYTTHERELGTKNITFRTKDSSNNYSDNFVVTINVVDTKGPVISGASEVKVSNSSPISIDDFKAKFSVNDDLEGEVTLNVSGFDAYLNDTSKVLTHTITLSAQDSSGNSVTKEISLIVEDRIAPEITLDGYFIVLDQGENLTKEQIIQYASKVLGINAESIQEIKGEYDTETPGEYEIMLTTITGETYSFNLSVNEELDNYVERDLHWYEYIYKWFTILFNIEDGYYHTDSFWDFNTRCTKISKLYSTGIYLDTNDNN